MTQEAQPRSVVFYIDQSGRKPFVEWLENLSISFQDRVLRRLQRVQLGNWGDYKRIGGGIFELRLHFGKGYRIYCAEDVDTVIVLLCGGNKDKQRKDVSLAKRYWDNYKNQKEQ